MGRIKEIGEEGKGEEEGEEGGREGWRGRRREGFDDVTLPALKMENKPQAKGSRKPPEGGKGKDIGFPAQPSEGRISADTLILAWWAAIQTFALQSCKVIRLCCLWSFVTAATDNYYKQPCRPNCSYSSDFY